ncbi:MAG: protein-export chaperone SecB [Saccharofermentanales bacterium]
MLIDSCLQFWGYEVKSISFELSDAFGKIREFRILPEFSVSLSEPENEIYKVQLSVSIKSSEEKPQPFDLNVTMIGRFSIQMDNEDEVLKQTLLRDNTVAIMFPFVRSIVASLTVAANIPPLLLPVINVSETLKNNPDSRS